MVRLIDYFKYTLIVANVDISGFPKEPIQGNELCWFGNFEFVTKDMQDENTKLLQNYNYRKKKYGTTNVGHRAATRAISEWCKFVDVKKEESINNMWARKTFVQTGLKDLQLPAQQIMEVTGHRSEVQMRKDYHNIQV